MKIKFINKKKLFDFDVHYTGAFNLWKWSSNTFTFCVLLKFIWYFSKKKNKNTEMKKDKCNSRESWFLLFMPENHNFHPNFIEIPFINVSKDFLDTMTLTLWDFKKWWLPHFCIISLSIFLLTFLVNFSIDSFVFLPPLVFQILMFLGIIFSYFLFLLKFSS